MYCFSCFCFLFFVLLVCFGFLKIMESSKDLVMEGSTL